ncbi:hypothetical protein SK128_009607 [Halocaridina rubra]|uniref:Uncharacterized protein n=1 Tax=Halocaridina rubra TaxID=373956 RepID=A0AAN8XJF3_HALRR
MHPYHLQHQRKTPSRNEYPQTDMEFQQNRNTYLQMDERFSKNGNKHSQMNMEFPKHGTHFSRNSGFIRQSRNQFSETSNLELVSESSLNAKYYVKETKKYEGISLNFKGQRKFGNITKQEKRHFRSKRGCQGTGHYGFNSYDLLTFALLTFNGVISTINNVNINNNNNNVNADNITDETYNEVNSNSESSSSVIIIVPPIGRRRKRNDKKYLSPFHISYETAVNDAFNVLLKINEFSGDYITCKVEYELCVYFKNSHGKFGSGILNWIPDLTLVNSWLLDNASNSDYCENVLEKCNSDGEAI